MAHRIFSHPCQQNIIRGPYCDPSLWKEEASRWNPKDASGRLSCNTDFLRGNWLKNKIVEQPVTDRTAIKNLVFSTTFFSGPSSVWKMSSVHSDHEGASYIAPKVIGSTSSLSGIWWWYESVLSCSSFDPQACVCCCCHQNCQFPRFLPKYFHWVHKPRRDLPHLSSCQKN